MICPKAGSLTALNKVPLSSNNPSLILASASPRRLELLSQIGVIPDQVIPADIDESPLKSEKPREIAARLAAEKAAHIAKTNQGHFILASDTVVACGNRILGKAQNSDEAKRFLELLSGRSHKVYTGVTLICPTGEMSHRTVATSVKFNTLSVDDIAFYLSHDEWKGKAGAYAIQGLAARFIRSINGSYSNVVGLPLFEVTNMLKGRGFPL